MREVDFIMFGLMLIWGILVSISLKFEDSKRLYLRVIANVSGFIWVAMGIIFIAGSCAVLIDR